VTESETPVSLMANTEFIVAKVRGMRGKLYEGNRLSRLCDHPTVEDLATTLAPDQPIGDTIDLQRSLTTRHVADLCRILTHLDAQDAELFLVLLKHYQVENLKVLLRCWTAGADPATLARYTVDVPPPLALPTVTLMKSPDLETLVKAIPIPWLREGALLGLGEFEESGRLFFAEAGLDRAYFRELKHQAQHTRGPARQTVLELVDLEIDIYNVALVLRAVFNYSILFNKIRHFLAPLGARAGLPVLEEIRSAENLDAAVPLVPPGLLHADAPVSSGDQLETAMWRNLYRVANRRYYTAVLDFGAVVAFYYVKRVELSNLIRVSECIRYGEHGDAIRKKLTTLAPAVAGSR